jgi:hypothetical protein
MTVDHALIDKLGEIHRSRQVMRKGWKSFFNSYPDYRNILTRVQVVERDLVLMMGYSSCSHPPLDGPALWSAKIRGGRVSECRVY